MDVAPAVPPQRPRGAPRELRELPGAGRRLVHAGPALRGGRRRALRPRASPFKKGNEEKKVLKSFKFSSKFIEIHRFSTKNI